MGASTDWNGRDRPFIPLAAADCTAHPGPSQLYCGHKSWSVSLWLLGCSKHTLFHGLYGWLTAYPTLPQPTVEA